jgi:2-octaprenyl-6-methoxyphenol hydroxylase
MRIIDDSVKGSRDVEAPFHACDIGLPRFGFNVPNDVLRAALFETARKNANVKIRAAALKDYEISRDAAIADLEDGTEIRAGLIVGADGRNSRVRKIANIKAGEKDYGQTAITALISHAKSHDDASTEFHRGSGPFALVPMPGKRCAVVWVEPAARADEILRLRRDEFIRLLSRNTRGILGDIRLESGPESWPLKSMNAESLTAPRAALIAEAAHVMSPIAAQGLNLSLRDAAALAETVTDWASISDRAPPLTPTRGAGRTTSVSTPPGSTA